MRHYWLDQMDWFHCVDSACPMSCCENWGIPVDEESDRFYQTAGGEFGAYLNENIDREKNPPMFKLHHGRCAFLNEENLCRIYIELGKDRMCQICTEYPRIYATNITDFSLHYLTLSCPEVARHYLSQKEPLSLSIEQEGDDNAPLSGTFALAVDVFILGLRILQDRSLGIAQRQRLLLVMSRAVMDAAEKGDGAEAGNIIDFFSAPENLHTLPADTAVPDVAAKVRFFRELSEFIVKDHPENTLKTHFTESLRFFQSLGAEENAAKFRRCLEEMREGDFQIEQEHLLTYAMFRNFFIDTVEIGGFNFFHRALYTVIFTQFYLIFTAVLSAEQDSPLAFQQRVLIASSLSRYFDHALSKFTVDLNNTLRKAGFSDMGFLFRLIS